MIIWDSTALTWAKQDQFSLFHCRHNVFSRPKLSLSHGHFHFLSFWFFLLTFLPFIWHN